MKAYIVMAIGQSRVFWNDINVIGAFYEAFDEAEDLMTSGKAKNVEIKELEVSRDWLKTLPEFQGW